MAHEAAVSDYERVGGGAAIRVVVDRFYDLVLGDERLASFFTDSNLPQLKRHQALLIAQVLGGPAEYDGRDLQEAHAGLQIGRGDYALVVAYLAQALREAGVDEEIINRVGSVLASTEKDVVAVGGH
ncbi:MAG TPA: group 1 truncated hemoglobin [Nocardioidaceae bacterium]